MWPFGPKDKRPRLGEVKANLKEFYHLPPEDEFRFYKSSDQTMNNGRRVEKIIPFGLHETIPIGPTRYSNIVELVCRRYREILPDLVKVEIWDTHANPHERKHGNNQA